MKRHFPLPILAATWMGLAGCGTPHGGGVSAPSSTTLTRAELVRALHAGLIERPADAEVFVPPKQSRWQLFGRRPPVAGLHRPGVGVPVIARLRSDEANAPRGGFHLPRTAVLRSEAGSVSSVALLDPREITLIKVGSKRKPLAMNLEAPLDATKGLGPGALDGIRHLFPTSRFSGGRLVFLEPFDPDRVPVVLVHGLLSTPRMWSPVVKGLLADPAIRARYQFWFFHYPTWQPIPLSALQLRQALDEARRVHRVRQPLVLVGHSMGGLLTRAQITSIVPTEAERMVPRVSALPTSHRVRQALIFDPRPDVARAVFIATPHRGSELALHGVSGFAVRLIRFPAWIQQELTEFADLTFGDRARRIPTSICGLSPNSRFLHALDRAPSSVPMHSLIANRGRGDLERSSDGVVPYSSAHRADADSEFIIPGGHGAFSHPSAIQELRRILLLDGGDRPTGQKR